MSRSDIAIKETGGLNSVPVDRWVTNSGTATLIKAGEPAKASTAIASQQHSILLVDADMTIGTDKNMTGIAANDSTDTASATGYSDQFVLLESVKWEIKAKSAAAADTQSEIDAFSGYQYIIDLTSSVFTMDTAGGTSTSNAFLILGGDPKRSTVHFRINQNVTFFGSNTV